MRVTLNTRGKPRLITLEERSDVHRALGILEEAEELIGVFFHRKNGMAIGRVRVGDIGEEQRMADTIFDVDRTNDPIVVRPGECLA